MNGYKKYKVLGKGTYGTVYLCEKKTTRKKIVLKEISKTLDEFSVKVANNEVQILQKLNHPNIIKYYSNFITKNVCCIFMEFASKGNLYEYISKRKPDNYISQKVVLQIFCQILLGLNHIHSKNILHRDLKSENILISGHKYDVIKIADFGISKILDSDGYTNTGIGTTNYLAPEICDAKPYNVKSDIWSLGCILYEICALERLFDGSISSVVLSIVQRKLKNINYNLYSFELQEIINKMLRYEPSVRPSTNLLMQEPILIPFIFKLFVNLGNTVAQC